MNDIHNGAAAPANAVRKLKVPAETSFSPRKAGLAQDGGILLPTAYGSTEPKAHRGS
jgi:hypothetical protein